MEVPRGTLIIYCKTLVNPTTTDSVELAVEYQGNTYTILLT